jgi:hypothetical protein
VLALRELPQKLLDSVPRHPFHRMLWPALEMAGVAAHHRFPLGLRHQVSTEIKRLADSLNL